MNGVPLSPGREARLKFAFIAAYDARGGDRAEFRRRLEELIDLHERLRCEQLAELGYMPSTVEGCIATLHVAARIYEVMAGADGVA